MVNSPSSLSTSTPNPYEPHLSRAASPVTPLPDNSNRKRVRFLEPLPASTSSSSPKSKISQDIFSTTIKNIYEIQRQEFTYIAQDSLLKPLKINHYKVFEGIY